MKSRGDDLIKACVMEKSKTFRKIRNKNLWRKEL